MNEFENGRGDIRPEHTRVSTPITRLLAAAIALIMLTSASVMGYSNLNSRINTMEAHTQDTQVHLNPLYHVTHGQPVGNFDFTIAIERLSNKVDEMQRRPILIGENCRKQGSKLLCEQSE